MYNYDIGQKIVNDIEAYADENEQNLEYIIAHDVEQIEELSLDGIDVWLNGSSASLPLLSRSYGIKVQDLLDIAKQDNWTQKDLVFWISLCLNYSLPAAFKKKYFLYIPWYLYFFEAQYSLDILCQYMNLVEHYNNLDCSATEFQRKTGVMALAIKQNITADFLKRYSSLIYLNVVAEHNFHLDEFALSTLLDLDKCCAYGISQYQTVSLSFIEKYKDILHWSSLCLRYK